MEIITSKDNARFKGWKSLLSKKGRKEKDLFMVESLRGMEEGAKKGIVPVTLLLREGESLPGFLADRKQMEVFVLKEALFEDLCETKTPQGYIGIYKKMEWYVSDLMEEGPLLYLDGIQDPGNLGSILRSAAAFDVAGLILGDGCGDIFSGKVIRSSMGGIFSTPFIHGGIPLLRVLKGRGYCLTGCDMGGDSIVSTYLGSRKTIIALGNENKGLSDNLRELCDQILGIPMEDMESLNVGVATGIFLYKAYVDRKN